MNMVGSAASGQNLEPQVVRNPGQASVKPFLQFSRNQITALFGAEDAMHEISGVSVRHEEVPSLKGLWS
jgi:hypothetical protein